jgi:primosomal protein N' (replication factor Y)
VRKRSDLEHQLERFSKGEAKILIGTQMVAKGHDFPKVTLVGVISADSSLNFPDFRAAERTFQLLTQVSGRAGRGKDPGRVLVQTYETGHYAITCALRHDYEAFVARELEARRELSYPPFSYLALLRFESLDEDAALQAAQYAAERLAKVAADHGVSILGPAAAPLARLKGWWRIQVLLKAPTRNSLRLALGAAGTRLKGNVRLVLDMDPFSML